MKLIKYIVLSLSIILLICTSVYGADFNCEINKNIIDNKVTIKVNAAANTQYAFQVLKKDDELSILDTATIPEIYVTYTGDFNTDKNGDAEVEMTLKKTDDLVAYFQSADGGNIVSFDFYFSDKDDYENIIKELNGYLKSGNKDAFKEKLFNKNDNGIYNLKALGFYNDLFETINQTSVSNMFYNECKPMLSSNEYLKSIYKFNAVTAVAALNENVSDDLFAYYKDYVSEDETLKELITKFIKGSREEEYLTSKMKNKNIDSLNKLIEECRNAIILTAVKYPDGNINIKNVFEEYKNILNISKVASNGEIYNNLAGKDFSDISSLVLAYKNEVNRLSDSKSGNGGGSGGSSKNQIVVEETGISPETGKEKLKIKFNDLDSLDWEYPSVSRLYEAGIVNGYNEFEFKPDNTVKREEFIKMLVCALGLENSQYEASIFDDTKGSWCEPYVCIAYKHGISKGIGNNLFGLGLEISRQDMAVMVYNALVKQGLNPQNSVIEYKDADSIYDYAKQPISELTLLGIIGGMGDNMFKPYESATRAQAAVIIDRALAYMK